MTNRDQLANFGALLAQQTNRPRLVFESWHDAFFWLNEFIDGKKRTVVLLDEISWMGAYDPDFPGHLKWAWDKLFHKHDKLVMVVCGSVSAWIKRNILDNTGFVGRFSRDYILPELRLDENRLFPWKWPDDPSWDKNILYAKDASNAGRSNWIRLKLNKALSWDNAVALMNGFKKDTDKDSRTFGQYVVRNPGAAYDLKGYSCSNGDTVDIDDREALLAHVGQNVWKEIKMKLVGPREQAKRGAGET